MTYAWTISVLFSTVIVALHDTWSRGMIPSSEEYLPSSQPLLLHKARAVGWKPWTNDLGG
jgi:hypothetical protein